MKMKPLYGLFHLSLKEDEQIANKYRAGEVNRLRRFGDFIVYGIN